MDCTLLAVDHDTVESLWVRMKGKAKKADVGVYYEPPNQDDNTDQLFYKELRDLSRSAVLVQTLTGNIQWTQTVPGNS